MSREQIRVALEATSAAIRGAGHAAIRRLTSWPAITTVLALIGFTAFTALSLYVEGLGERSVAITGTRLAALAASVGDDVDALMSEHYHTVGQLARRVSELAAAHQPLQAALQGELDGGRTQRDVTITDASGVVVAAVDPSRIGDWRGSAAWFVRARERLEPSLDDPAPAETDGAREWSVGLTAPILDLTGEFRGVVHEDLVLSALLYRLRRQVKVLGGGESGEGALQWMLLDRNHVVIADSDFGQEGTVNLRALGVPSATAPPDPGWVEERHGRIDRRVITGFADVGGTGQEGVPAWRVLLRMDRAAAVAPLRRLSQPVVALLALVLLPLTSLLVLLVAQRRHAEASLRREHDLLEARVTERTAELETANAALEAEIADRRQTETALRTSEARWRTISGLTSDWAYSYRCTAEGELFLDWVTDAFVRATGFTAEDVRARGGLQTLVHPDDLPGILQRVQRHTGGKPLEGESRLVTRSGAVRWVRDRGTKVDTDLTTGDVIIYGAAEDVTVRREAEAAIHASEEQLSDFFENAPVGLHWIGPDGVLLRANRAELELLGYAHDEYVGHHVGEFHVDRDVAEEILRRLAAGETVHEREVRLRCKDGTIRHALVDANVWWCDGAFVHARCFTRDVTREHLTRELLERGRAQAEQQTRELERGTAELEQARNAALAAARAKSQFLANMSHEIRTPMTAMLGYAELLTDGRLRRAERQSYIDTIRRNGEYLLRLINDILDLSKIEAGKLVLEAVTFSLPDLVGEVERLLREHAAGKGLGFEVTVSSETPVYVCADPTRIRQILVNLIGNAIKFTETGTVRLTVDAEPAPVPGHQRVRFTVVDTGIGMEREQQTRLFEPFGQADASTTRTFGGTGLGLAISARLAAALGGRIDVRSVRGRGSAFTLTLDVEPVGVGPPSHRAGRAEPDNQPIPPPRLAGRILLAEDAPDSRRLISFYLRKAGAHVETAENGRVACENVHAAEAEGKPFDLILLDMQMPMMDGYAAAAALRERGVRTPIVALTAHAMDGDRGRCLDVGCDDYLTKPVERSALLRTLRAHLDAAGRERRMRTKKTTERPKRASRPRTAKVDDEMLSLLRLFVDELQGRADALETSLAKRDMVEVGGLAHQLKGSARAYGFPHITDRAAELEESIRVGRDLDHIRVQVETVAALCREVRHR